MLPWTEAVRCAHRPRLFALEAGRALLHERGNALAKIVCHEGSPLGQGFGIQHVRNGRAPSDLKLVLDESKTNGRTIGEASRDIQRLRKQVSVLSDLPD